MEILDYEGYAGNFLRLPERKGDHFLMVTEGCGCCSDIDELTREQTLRVLECMRQQITEAINETKKG